MRSLMIITLVAALGTSIPTKGAIGEVFSELGLVMAIMGGLGGALNGIINFKSIWSIVRGTAVGGLLAFGIGILSVPLMIKYLELPEGSIAGTTAQTFGGAAFILGMLQERVVEFVRGAPKAVRVKPPDDS